MTKYEYNDILDGIYKGASENKFRDSLKNYSNTELRKMLLDSRQKQRKFESNAIDTELVIRQLKQ